MSQDKSKLKCFEFLSPLSQKEITKAFREKDKEIEELKEQLEQERVKLAGCGCEALGYAKDCNKGDYGYSASFQDVRDLREKYEQLLSRVTVEGIANIIAKAEIIKEVELATAIYKMIKGDK